MTSHIPLSSSELATLWMTYQQKTMSQRLLEHFIEHAEDEEAKEILTSTHNKIVHYIERH